MWKRTGEGLQAQSEGGEGRISPESSAGQASGGGLLAPPSGALGTVVVVGGGTKRETASHETEPALLGSPGTATLGGGSGVPGETEEDEPRSLPGRGQGVGIYTPPNPPDTSLWTKPGCY